MTAIKTIIEAEKRAEEIVNNAYVAAQKDIADSKKKQRGILNQVDMELKEDRLKQIREQKVDLSSLYKKILDESETKVENLKKVILAKRGKALIFVLDSFVK
jgi:vacuolar-type H+-ATPase subunit H